ncbi:MAG: cellulase family glycosylhydrolase [Salinivirgaceae bacterium]|jgi:endoglucanase|nr:cellulase family glycosylhydrolase [Salinivirgaceae bacterium]
MKAKTLLFLALAVALFSCNGPQKETEQTEKVEESFVIKRGLNASHWISQSEKRGDERSAYMKAEDFKKIADMGFDHVRLPVDEMHLWDENGVRNDTVFKLLHFGISECLKNNLRCIVDLHVLRSHHFNAANGDGEGANRLWEDDQAQQDFIKFWKELSAELKDYPNSMVAYEPMNEAVADDHEDWNKLINWVISEIRKLEPERTIIMGSNKWQGAWTFPYLKVPEGDKNIILSFHTYTPIPFTHYRASWNPVRSYDGSINYPGIIVDTNDLVGHKEEAINEIMMYYGAYNADVFEKEILPAVKVADSLGLQLFCGEFGCFPTTPMEMRQQWYTDMISVFEKHNIAWAHWNYKNDFPVVDAETLEPIDEILSVIIK